MIPLYLDPTQTRVAVIGRGALAARRVQWLRDAGADPDLWSDAPDADLIASGVRMRQRLPNAQDLSAYQAIWIADLPRAEAELVHAIAKASRVIVNVEDVPVLCDFHTPAVVRRGKLTLAAGTGGASPAVARAARQRLEAAFPEQWATALDDIAQSRLALRQNGAGFDELVADADERLAAHGLN